MKPVTWKEKYERLAKLDAESRASWAETVAELQAELAEARAQKEDLEAALREELEFTRAQHSAASSCVITIEAERGEAIIRRKVAEARLARKEGEK